MSQSVRRGHGRLARLMICLVVASGFVAGRQSVHSASVLLSHWELDEGSGTTITDSVDGDSGTLHNGAAWVTGHSGSAVNMDGVDDYIALSALEVTGSAITLAAWIKTSSFPSGVNQRFIAKAAGGTEQQTYWMLGHANDGAESASFQTPGRWTDDDLDWRRPGTCH